MVIHKIEVLRIILAVAPLFVLLNCTGQPIVFQGMIKDEHSQERIPFASVHWTRFGTGVVSDSAGRFTFHLREWSRDTLVFSYVGYKDYRLPINPRIADGLAAMDTVHFLINLQRGPYEAEAIVRKSIDKGPLLWRKIVRRRPFNDRYRFANFSYEPQPTHLE